MLLFVLVRRFRNLTPPALEYFKVILMPEDNFEIKPLFSIEQYWSRSWVCESNENHISVSRQMRLTHLVQLSLFFGIFALFLVPHYGLT